MTSSCLNSLTDWQDRVDSRPVGRIRLASLLGVLEWHSDWMSLPLKGATHGEPSRVVPHNHCRLDSSPEMGSSPDAALKRQAIYNYLFLFFFWRRCHQQGKWGTTSSSNSPTTIHVLLNHLCPLLSSAYCNHAVFEPLLWSWGGTVIRTCDWYV